MPFAVFVASLALLPASLALAAETPPTPKTTATTTAPTGASPKAIEGVTSTIFQQHQSSFSGIGLRMRVQVPQLIEGFSVVPMIEYWRNTSTLSDFDLETTRKDATLGALLRYDWAREGWKPYFGAGVGMHFLSSHVDAPSLGLNDESESVIKGGVMLLAGVKFGLAGKLGNLMELEYHGVGAHSQLKFNWGLSYDF
jgi:opacity protein-like surface antigen